MARKPSIVLHTSVIPLALLVLCLALLYSCESAPIPHPEVFPTILKYEVSSDDVPNPERGLYYYADEYVTFPGDSSAPCTEALDLTDVQDHRNKNLMTLMLRHYNLLQFRGRRISRDDHFMKCLEADFKTIRDSGVKVILKFSYNPTKGATAFELSDKPNPQEASLNDVLHHIEDLGDVLVANSDVIAVWQAGFIGTWGEWHYSNDVFGYGDELSETQYGNRKKVVEKMLSVLPANRSIQLRTPKFKQKHLGIGTGAENAINETQAFNQSVIARLGVFDDCFVYDEFHRGTFSRDAVLLGKDKEYLNLESRYLPVGGETCVYPQGDTFHLWNNALLNFKRFHWSFLNGGYAGILNLAGNQTLQREWGIDKLREISKFIGYRFALEGNGSFSFDNAKKQLHVDFTVTNLGWAAPFNPRGAEVIIRRCDTAKCGAGAVVKRLDLLKVNVMKYDPRRWTPEAGPVKIKELFDLTGDPLTVGTYELLFSLPDPETSLFGRADYSIRLANNLTWEETTGFNRLAYSFEVK